VYFVSWNWHRNIAAHLHVKYRFIRHTHCWTVHLTWRMLLQR